MKSRVNCAVMVVALLALNGMASRTGAKTIVVDSIDATALVRPVSHFAVTDSGSGLTLTRVSTHSPDSLSGLYDEGRRLAPQGLHAAPALREAPSMMAPVQQSDFRAMLLVGAVLIAQELRRKHRSLKRSVIAG